MSPTFVWRAPAGRVVLAILFAYARRSAASWSRPSPMRRSTTVSRSYTPSTGRRLHVWKRCAGLAVAIVLLALPVSVLAEEDETDDHVSDILITTVADPAYVWDGRLAASYSALVVAPGVAPVAAPAYVWDGRLAASYSAPVTAPVAASIADPAYVWDPAGRAAMVRDHFLLEPVSQSQG